MELRFCSLLHPHTLCHLSLHSGHCLELSGSVTESATAWQLSLLHADRKKAEITPAPPPLYHDNPSFICYIAYYLHNNWCLIFYPSTLRRIEVSFRVSACKVDFILYTCHTFLSYFGPQTTTNNSSWSPLYGGKQLNWQIMLPRGHKYIIVTMAKVWRYKYWWSQNFLYITGHVWVVEAIAEHQACSLLPNLTV